MNRLSEIQIEAAGYRFEQCRGRQLAASELSLIRQAGFQDVDPKRLADLLWDTLAKPQPAEYRTSAYWALGKRGDKTDKAKLISALRTEVEAHIRVGYQIMIALDNLGEPVFSRDSRGYHDDDENRRDALAYLARQR
jgi:hypothetical protein